MNRTTILIYLSTIFPLSIYCNDLDSIPQILEGEIIEYSMLPSVDEIDYPDCNYSVIFKINSKDSLLKINLVLRGITDKKLLEESKYKNGDKLRINAIPFETAPTQIKQTQLVEDVYDFELETYYAINSSLIQSYTQFFTLEEKNNNAQELIYNKNYFNESILNEREKSIQNQLDRIDQLLNQNGGNWKSWKDNLKEIKTAYAVHNSELSDTWINNSFFSAGRAYREARTSNFIESIIEFDEYLKSKNIHLIICRVPFKGEIAADYFVEFNPFETSLNVDAYQKMHELLQNRIETIDIVPEAIKQRLNFPLMYWYQDFDELHPAEGISFVIADELSKITSRYNFKPNKFIIAQDSFSRRKFKWPNGSERFDSSNLVTFKSIRNIDSTYLEISYEPSNYIKPNLFREKLGFNS